MMTRGSEEAVAYVPPCLSREQMAAIEYLIAKSGDATDFAKKVIIWFIRQTNGLTEQVALSVPEIFLGQKAEEIQNGVHDMSSSYGGTHIGMIFKAIGTKMHLHHCCGVFVEGVFSSTGEGRTVWCAYESSCNLKLLAPPTAEELGNIDLCLVTHPWSGQNG